MASIDKTANKFIGQGIIFPITLNASGRPDVVSGGDLIKSSIINILSFAIGTRYMLGEFGGNLESLLQEPNDNVLQATVKFYTVDMISKWEKRIDLLDVKLDNRTDDKINIQLTYSIKGTKIVDSFIFPYYSQLIY